MRRPSRGQEQPPQAASTSIAARLIFDGGSRGNPGDSYGSFSLAIDGEQQGAPRRLRFGLGTNNRAEYLALIAGLEALLDLLASQDIPPQQIRLEILGDSRLVLHQAQGEWKVRKSALKPLNARVRQLLTAFGQVSFLHQPRSATVRALGH